MATRTKTRRRNPVPPSSVEQDIEAAKKHYKRFTGQEPDLIEWIEVPEMHALAGIGEIDAIEYTTVRDGVEERYRHQFRARSRPLFGVSPDGKMIVVLGGAFVFTERGIVDQ